MPEIRILESGDDAVLRNVAPGVFDNALDPALVAEFLHDKRHHLAVAIDQMQSRVQARFLPLLLQRGERGGAA